MQDSTVIVEDSTVIGGIGGATAAPLEGSQLQSATIGGVGGDGILTNCFTNCNSLLVDNSTVTGGDGGGGDDVGSGGQGINLANDNLEVTNSIVTGGSSGSGPTDGSGGWALFLYFGDGGNFDAIIQNNTLTGGTGQHGAQTAGLSVSTGNGGSVCVDAGGNTSTGGFELYSDGGGTLGITQASTAAMSTANNGAPVFVIAGLITFNCVIAP